MRALESLRLFDHLAGTRHFGRTSAECHVSQPTLSRTISRLEAELGVRLLDRDRRTVALTPEGIRFQAFARDVLEAWRSYASRHAADDPVSGTLSMFSTVTAAQTILPDVLRRFRDAHPAVRLVLETGYAAEALQRLDDPAIDVTVAALPPRPPRHLVTHVIATTALAFVAQADGPHRLPPERSAVWTRTPFILPAAGVIRTLVDRWFRRMRVRPTVVAEEHGHEALLSLVALGFGVGVVPELVAAASPLANRFEILPIAEPLPSFDIAVCSTPDRLATQPVAAFWDTLLAGVSATDATVKGSAARSLRPPSGTSRSGPPQCG